MKTSITGARFDTIVPRDTFDAAGCRVDWIDGKGLIDGKGRCG